MKALWNGAVLAESEDTELIDGKYFFPPDSIDYRYFIASDTHTADQQRGLANYYSLDVGGKRLPDAAWFYPAPLDVDEITGYVTFAPEVEITESR